VYSVTPGSSERHRIAANNASRLPVLPGSGPDAAWVDYSGNLRVGQLAAGAQHIVTRAGASPTSPLVAIGDDIFWVRMSSDTSRGNPPPVVDELDVASGIVRRVTQGQTIFPSVDSRSLFVVQSNSSLLEVPVRSIGTRRTFVIPSGWYLTTGGGLSNPIAVANGIIVQSSQGQTGRTPPTAAIWNPRTGMIMRLGPDRDLSAHTRRPALPTVCWPGYPPLVRHASTVHCM
jgi:hypothetical protein